MKVSEYHDQLAERAQWDAIGLPVLAADVESPVIRRILSDDAERERVRRDLVRQAPMPVPPRGGEYLDFCGYTSIEPASVSLAVGGVRAVWPPGRDIASSGRMCYDWYRFAWAPAEGGRLKSAGGWLWEGGQSRGPGAPDSKKHPEDWMFVLRGPDVLRARSTARLDGRVDAFLQQHGLPPEARQSLSVVEWVVEFPEDARSFAPRAPVWSLRVSEVIAPAARVALSVLICPRTWRVTRVEEAVYMEFGR